MTPYDPGALIVPDISAPPPPEEGAAPESASSPDGESPRTADQLVELVRRYLPDWNGVGDPRFAQEEIGYKRRAAEKAAELLDEDELRQLATREQFGEILGRLKKVAQATNLLYLGTPSTGDLAVLHADNLEPRSFTEAVLDLLYGDGDSPDRLERFSTYLDERSLPNKWTFPTYLLFLRFPETEMFVKPRATRWFLDRAGAEIEFGSRPTAGAYRTILALVHALLTDLEPLGARDLIDVQSVLFVAYQVSRDMKQLQPSDAKRREIERLFEDFVRQYLDTEEGREHMAAYPKARQEAQQSFAEIKAAREAGEDVTDRVLLELLPYQDSERNREQGAWIHIAPAITGDLKKWFEAKGWRQPDDWNQVADAVFHFIEQATQSPGQLAEACRKFDALEWSTGLQAGMLSPSLNALRPDEFLLANSKPRLIINYLAGKKLTPKLVEYPEVNRTGKILIEHLADLLETGAAVGDGYRIDDVFDTFTHWLIAIRHFPVNRHWKVAPGEGAKYWDKWVEGGHMSIGWGDLGDLSRLSYEEFEQKRDELVEADGNMKPERLNQVWKFAHEIREGDKIVANEGTGKVLGFGTVTGPYEFHADDHDHGHRRPVDWDDTSPRDVDEGGWRRTLVTLDREKFEKLVGLPMDSDGDAADKTSENVNPRLPIPDLANALHLDPQEVERWVRAVERKKQVIFYGPPGTGKTYAAEHLADHLIGGGQGFTELIQFHPSYAYEDFMQGIRPEPLPGGGLDYPIRDGRFLAFCRRAQDTEDHRCVLIIDEINRANLSRVFGELMYLLENRERHIPLAAGGESFAIPGNVRIIGTMNTADRSIALVDHALRRRFAFLRMGPDYEVLRRFHETRDYAPEPLLALMTEVNQAIGDPHYELGITYFLLDDLEDQLADVWSLEIVPYLEEYFADRPDEVERFRWPNVQARLLP